MNVSKLLAGLVLASGACAAVHAQGAGSTAADAATPLTRAEVLAELQIWRESGMAALSDGEGETATFDARLRAETRYAQMRTSPAFAARVESLARPRSAALRIASE